MHLLHDDWRPRFHLAPPYGLMNDPNGLIYHDGVYHVFYQWNPDACRHGAKHWGHFVSTDLVHWQALPAALAPDTDYESHGCYSGSAVVHEGGIALFYTGNARSDDGGRSSTQCVAYSADGVSFAKVGPVIPTPPRGYTAHFRDPKVWREGADWFMVVGAQTEDEKGTVLLYRGKSLSEWSFVGELLSERAFGYMCECPDVATVDGREILLFCPQGLAPEGERFHNIYQAGYLVGGLDRSNGRFVSGGRPAFEELDRGFDFYAPQTFVDGHGRTLMFGWMGMPEEEETPTVANGWTHCLTLPRELRFENGRLYQRPPAELEAMRGKPHVIDRLSLFSEPHDEYWLPFFGAAFELQLTIDATADAWLDLCVGHGEFTRLAFDQASRRLSLDRSASGRGITPAANNVRRSAPLAAGPVDLRIFVDHSCIEIFVNGGEQVFSARVYPAAGSDRLRLGATAPAQARNIVFWPLDLHGPATATTPRDFSASANRPLEIAMSAFHHQGSPP